MERLKLIDGGGKPKAYRKRSKRESEPLVCECGSATFIEVRTGAQIRDGKISGGTKQLACFHCRRIATV
jgi:hypothetical protein